MNGHDARIRVRLAIRRDVVASFDPDRLSEATGIPVATLLTPFDTWDDGTAEIFSDYVFEEEADHGFPGVSVWDWSTIEDYKITEEQE